MASDKTTVKKRSVKHLIELLEKDRGGLRQAARDLGINHQNLMYWREGKNDKFLDTLEKIRLLLKIPKAEFWSKIMQGKK